MTIGARFSIEFEFAEGLSPQAREVIVAMGARWSGVISSGLPAVQVGPEGRTVSDLLIRASGKPIDKPGQVLAHGWATYLRPPAAGNAAYLPAVGEIVFDTNDVQSMEETGTLGVRAMHEIGHILGFDTQVWARKGVVDGYGGTNPVFRGTAAVREYGTLLREDPTAVPLENRGGLGVANVHWRESVFGSEIMSSYASLGSEPLSRVTIAALEDLGYQVTYSAADPYELPKPGFMTQILKSIRGARALMPHRDPSVAVVLPNSALLVPPSR